MGLVNFTEGLIDHEILGIHHVVQKGNHMLLVVLFPASGVGLMLIGWVFLKGQS